MTLLPLFGPIGPEILVIVGILVLLFGANKIPKLARNTGKATKSFFKGKREAEKEVEELREEQDS